MAPGEVTRRGERPRRTRNVGESGSRSAVRNRAHAAALVPRERPRGPTTTLSHPQQIRPEFRVSLLPRPQIQRHARQLVHDRDGERVPGQVNRLVIRPAALARVHPRRRECVRTINGQRVERILAACGTDDAWPGPLGKAEPAHERTPRALPGFAQHADEGLPRADGAARDARRCGSRRAAAWFRGAGRDRQRLSERLQQRLDDEERRVVGVGDVVGVGVPVAIEERAPLLRLSARIARAASAS